MYTFPPLCKTYSIETELYRHLYSMFSWFFLLTLRNSILPGVPEDRTVYLSKPIKIQKITPIYHILAGNETDPQLPAALMLIKISSPFSKGDFFWDPHPGWFGRRLRWIRSLAQKPLQLRGWSRWSSWWGRSLDGLRGENEHGQEMTRHHILY